MNNSLPEMRRLHDDAAQSNCCADAQTSASDAAIHYARDHCLRIVPVLLEPTFRPLITNWPVAATTEIDVIQSWWREWPNALPAVATGQQSGVWVLDIDIKNEADGLASLGILEADYGDLGGSWTTATPSGGLHYWFAHPNDRAVRNVVGHLPGLDIRGDGGLVVLPPARRGTKHYEWLIAPGAPGAELRPGPVALLDELSVLGGQDVVLSFRSALSFSSASAAASYLARVVEGECATVSATGPGERNNQLFKSSARIGQFVGGNALPETVAERSLELAALECGLDGREARNTIRSGLKRGATSPQTVVVS